MPKKLTAYAFNDIDAVLQEIASLAKTIDTNKAKKKELEAGLIARARRSYFGQKMGSLFQKTISFLGVSRRATVTFADSFASVQLDQEPALRDAFGEQYDALFERKSALKIKDLPIETVRNLIGSAFFDQIFEVETVIQPRKEMDQQQMNFTEKQREVMEQHGVTQKAPTVQVRSLKPGESVKYNVLLED